jgi:AcrR family transcriptional regulator
MKAEDLGPPNPPRRKSRDEAKQETREALIAAGVSAFAEEGLDAPSLDSICARAGFTRGAFYVHFEDREDFLIAVMTTILGGFLDAIIATGDAAMDLQRTIDFYVAAVIARTLPTQGSIKYHQLLAACARSPRVRERYVEVLREGARRVAVAVREGQGAGTVRADVDPEQVAAILVGLVSGTQTLLELEYAFDAEKGGRALSEMLRPK